MSAPTMTTADLADTVTRLADLALAFGRIDRTAVYHPDDGPAESDSDHTVMLGWVACTLASACFPTLDVGLVAQFALVHDAPEVYAGDTQTLRISEDEKAAKRERERAALARLSDEFRSTPWLSGAIGVYEDQHLPEARFVRAVDKVLPKAVHMLDGARGLREFGIGWHELATTLGRQYADLMTYVGEFQALLDLHVEMSGRVIDLLGEAGGAA